ncbi:elongation factor Tu GTP binding domain containing protein [Babesia bovis T2Bo]|uniref:Elongation factor Tu GTP binding domain containing protein n=1 Tax=Babesia bovis TaxID=5865 RepID=A7ANX2_BABBO|nr:elongation factor Tu GTP binding domain containing protein [Babesia bovis T2Bo]EDO08256.1 elongation factor Tu GTP binding domain containing protein [Babesia bovis T2Bo]|eukprot:XP_001611824.1 elongation factor Tu GTP binding domain containing protein [Babesia bovis T2Bo]
MAAGGRYESYESDDSYTYTDDDAYDYDDFVVSGQKKTKSAGAKTQGYNKSHTTATKTNSKQLQPKPSGTVYHGSESNASYATGDSSTVAPLDKLTGKNKAVTRTQAVQSGTITSLNVVVCGRVDVGKSTLLGHLLTLLGAVDSRLLRESDMAWILDQGEDERARGITIDPTKASAIINLREPSESNAGSPTEEMAVTYPVNVKIDFIDTPGHHDLIANLVKGASFARAAIVVVDILDFLKEDKYGYFEQHLFILWALGVREFIICVNKVDRLEDVQMYKEAESRVKELTKPFTGSTSITIIPTSGLNGINLVKRDDSWGSGTSLVEALRQVARKTVRGSHTQNSIMTPPDAIVGHIFDMWENSKKQVGCSCFMETKIRTPSKLVSLPSGNPVTCSEMSSLLPTNQCDVSEPIPDNDTDLSSLMTQMKLTKASSAYAYDFVDNMILRDQEVQALAGDRLLVDKGTFGSIRSGLAFISETQRVICQVFVSPKARHRLTLGFDLEVFIGCFQRSGAVLSVWERATTGTWKRLTSLGPGKEGVLLLQLIAPVYVQSLPLENAKSVAPDMVASTEAQRPWIPLLSRILLKVGPDVIAGGIIVNKTP